MNVQIGESVSDDVRNSFFMTMDEQLEAFAKAVAEVRGDCERLLHAYPLQQLSNTNMTLVCNPGCAPRQRLQRSRLLSG